MAKQEKLRPVLCIGDLVLDIVSNPLSRLPGPGESMLTDKIACFPGGNALNTAVALRRMGDPVTMAGSIGDDALGKLLLEKLSDLGLDTRGVTRKPGGTTPATFIMRAAGEDRRFISTLGVGADFTGEDLAQDLIPRGGIVLIGGYLKLPAWNDDALVAFLREVRARNSRVVFNVCVVQNNGVDPRRCLRLLKYTDVFVPNEDEARTITGESTLARQAQVLRQAGARRVVITRGQQGLYAQDARQTITMDAFDVPVVDPSGCGDCFLGGLIAALRRDMDAPTMLKVGSAAGALGATALGCTSGIPSFEDIQRFVQDNSLRLSVDPGSASP
jgi:sugar/nucleoside kinase (ribokinase family)